MAPLKRKTLLKKRESWMMFLMKNLINAAFLMILVYSCSSRVPSRKIHFYVFDLKNKHLINTKSDILKLNDPTLKTMACLKKDDFSFLFTRIGDGNGSKMGTLPSVGGDKQSK